MGSTRRRRRIVLAVVATVVAAVGVIVLLALRSGAHPVAVSDATRPTGSTLPATRGVLRPPQGVYRFTGSGTDQLTTPPKSQAEGPEMPGTVTHDAEGCWTFRIDYSSNHWQSWRYCPHDGGMDEVSGTSYQRWDFVVFANETTSTFTCDSPTIKADQQPGASWDQTCTGTSTGTTGTARTTGPYRFVGTETLDVGGTGVAAHHYRRERTMSGAQTGSEHSDVWFSASTGMPLRNERHLTAKSATIIGDVTYTEDAEFRLASLDPVR